MPASRLPRGQGGGVDHEFGRAVDDTRLRRRSSSRSGRPGSDIRPLLEERTSDQPHEAWPAGVAETLVPGPRRAWLARMRRSGRVLLVTPPPAARSVASRRPSRVRCARWERPRGRSRGDRSTATTDEVTHRHATVPRRIDHDGVSRMTAGPAFTNESPRSFAYIWKCWCGAETGQTFRVGRGSTRPEHGDATDHDDRDRDEEFRR